MTHEAAAGEKNDKEWVSFYQGSPTGEGYHDERCHNVNGLICK